MTAPFDWSITEKHLHAQTLFRLVQCLISCLKGSSLCMRSDTMHFPRNCQLTEVSEAIHPANNLKAELKFTELETSFENTQSKSVRSV
jgi:hypothetical protein